MKKDKIKYKNTMFWFGNHGYWKLMPGIPQALTDVQSRCLLKVAWGFHAHELFMPAGKLSHDLCVKMCLATKANIVAYKINRGCIGVHHYTFHASFGDGWVWHEGVQMIYKAIHRFRSTDIPAATPVCFDFSCPHPHIRDVVIDGNVIPYREGMFKKENEPIRQMEL